MLYATSSALNATELLVAHNTYRCMHDVPLLVWDCDVAASAQAWADRGVFTHSDSYDVLPPAGPAGENLAMGHTSGAQATADWYSEISNWAFAPGDGTGTTGTTGHFTSMIWKGGKKLGCGHYPPTNIWLCRYKAGDTLTTDTPNVGSGAAYKANVLPLGPKSMASCASMGMKPSRFVHTPNVGSGAAYKANVLPLGPKSMASCADIAAASVSSASSCGTSSNGVSLPSTTASGAGGMPPPSTTAAGGAGGCPPPPSEICCNRLMSNPAAALRVDFRGRATLKSITVFGGPAHAATLDGAQVSIGNSTSGAMSGCTLAPPSAGDVAGIAGGAVAGLVCGGGQGHYMVVSLPTHLRVANPAVPPVGTRICIVREGPAGGDPVLRLEAA
eukprot:CAMPEP_0172206708 /NCGR_PEP_ID=MMETSP1050-20130122/33380_1 /TAXON_ID=233186 /ORGANISM="Cryptomonas curvata, Strain CCAP979/52" /LENGTH=386 /DNA_ID=CAMNT_0012885845 /DNA_START=51 /DNA_END=1212 /DNA_ORIENTATION=+